MTTSIGVAAVVTVALLGLGVAAEAVTEPPPPSLTASRNPVPPGGEVVLTVENCATAPRVHGKAINTGMPMLYEIEVVADGEVWTASFTPQDRYDLWLVAECEGTESATVLLDVDAPSLSFTRSPTSFWRPDDQPGWVYGTDCPPDTMATVVVSRSDLEGTHEVVLDELGDWQLEIAPLLPGETVHVVASCGDVDYEPISATREVGAPITAPPTTTPEDVDPSAAPPAAPLPSSPAYTG